MDIRTALGFKPASIRLLDTAHLGTNDPRRVGCDAIGCDQLATVAFDQGKGVEWPYCPMHGREMAAGWHLSMPAGAEEAE